MLSLVHPPDKAGKEREKEPGNDHGEELGTSLQSRVLLPSVQNPFREQASRENTGVAPWVGDVQEPWMG